MFITKSWRNQQGSSFQEKVLFHLQERARLCSPFVVLKNKETEVESQGPAPPTYTLCPSTWKSYWCCTEKWAAFVICVFLNLGHASLIHSDCMESNNQLMALKSAGILFCPGTWNELLRHTFSPASIRNFKVSVSLCIYSSHLHQGQALWNDPLPPHVCVCIYIVIVIYIININI